MLTLPDASKNSQSVKARHSPRDYAENGQRKHQFYSAIQGKGMNIHNDQKKSILNKLFKNGGKINTGSSNSHHNNNHAVTNNYTGVNASFNEQLMNQTNFGFNPARGTIVSTPNNTNGMHPQRDIIHIEPMNRRELNTQKRNRTQTIQIESPVGNAVNMHQRGGSLNIHDLYQHYHQKPKASS